MEGLQQDIFAGGAGPSVETTWTDIKDPKEKKKIQNRIAQRSYRQRMKARLENLQAKVDYHEQMNQEQLDLDGTPKDCSPQNKLEQQSPTTAQSLTPESPDDESQTGQQTHYEHAIENPKNGIYLQHPELESGNLHIPQNHHMLPEAAEQTLRSGYMCLSTKQQLESKHLTPPLTALSPQNENTNMMDRHELFLSEVNEAMEFDHSFDAWSSEILPPSRQQSSYPTNPLATPPQHAQRPSISSELAHVVGGDASGGTAGLGASSTTNPFPLSMSQGPPGRQALDERFESVLACTRAAGFESFDALVMAYYSGEFGESSPLAIEQRLSRNRGLPSVIANLFRDACQWSDWERRGFHQELLKTTEAMLISESHNSGHNFEAVLDREGNSQAIPGAKRMIQNELPNLWALMMALSAEHHNVWQRNRSNAALAAIMLLRYPGVIPNDQLLKLVSGLP